MIRGDGGKGTSGTEGEGAIAAPLRFCRNRKRAITYNLPLRFLDLPPVLQCIIFPFASQQAKSFEMLIEILGEFKQENLPVVKLMSAEVVQCLLFHPSEFLNNSTALCKILTEEIKKGKSKYYHQPLIESFYFVNHVSVNHSVKYSTVDRKYFRKADKFFKVTVESFQNSDWKCT